MAYDRTNNTSETEASNDGFKGSAAANSPAKKVVGPSAVPYEEQRRYQLYKIAKEKNIEGRSRMDKDELIAALRKLEE